MSWRVIQADVLDGLAQLEDGSIQTCVTSPPYYGLRDYGAEGQIGLEATPDEYVSRLVGVFREVRRVLRRDGTLWLNLGDSFGAGKQLRGMPWRVAFALQADGWILRSEVIWAKPNPMPESITDRPTKAHEHLFLLSKSLSYYYDADAVREENAPAYAAEVDAETNCRRSDAKVPVDLQTGHGWRTKAAFTKAGKNPRAYNGAGRNKRSVWTVATQPFAQAHFATFPLKLIEPCVFACSRLGDTVLDPFSGAGTTGVVACRHDRDYVGIELNPEYAEMSRQRIREDGPLLNVPSEVAA